MIQTSIIIPNRDNGSRLRACLTGVMANIDGRQDVEVIVVDNGSTDESRAVAANFPMKWLTENSVASPYPARNTGIKASRGAWIILLDSNCIPQPGWLAAAEAALRAGADYAGGPLLFEDIPPGDWTAQFDRLYAIITPEEIPQRTSLPALNLFVRRAAFQEANLFIPHIRSLGDMEWTNRAHALGLQIGWSEKAVVQYPAKTGRAFRQKMVRLGRGRKELYLYAGHSCWHPRWWWRVAKSFLPPSPLFVRRMQQLNTREQTGIPAWPLVRLCWLTKICRGWGMLWGAVHPDLRTRQAPPSL
ncbi:MAG: glycosyltransferase family 2 protein [Lewinella sp.]|nr:glycosyltransferase family 2 protein [Lewinella sp.]